MYFIFLFLSTAFSFHFLSYCYLHVFVFQTFHFQHMYSEGSKVYTLTIMQFITICLYMFSINESLI